MKKDIYKIADYLYNSLIKSGIKFNDYGYPVLPTECLIQDVPEQIVPYEHRNACINKSKTVVCHFVNDERLYPRLNTLDEDIKLLRGYMGVGGFDLSPRREFDKSLQDFNLLINRMVDAYRAVRGIKILPNFRTGGFSTVNSLSSYPVGSYYIVGTLGCSTRFIKQGDMLLRTKLLYARPGKLIVYGPLKDIYDATLDEFGMDYICFKDFRSASWPKKEVA